FLSGILFGFIRDFIRFFGMVSGAVSVPRRRKSNFRKSNENRPGRRVRFLRRASVFSADVLFFLLVTAVFAVLTYAFCGGKLRSYSLFSAAAGFYFYSVLPGKVIRIPLERGASFIRRAFRAVVRIVSVPFSRIGSAAKRKVATPLVSYLRRVREMRRRKRSEKRKGKKVSPDDAREVICSVGRR
ncbi:MAG: spore cortex biosynthesis protein YabQ, partial [Clostridia bacterium]|nr:spore cortex biosynthesis protein YabQ [Clostridia bacterium]